MFRKDIILTLAIVWSFASGVFAGEEYKNYEIAIDEKTYDLNINEKIEVVDNSGDKVTVILRKKPYTQYSDQMISFRHKSELSVSSQDLDNDITQIMTATAFGTLIIVQEYSNMDPTMLLSMMLKEVTKESVEYGYKMTQENVTHKLKSGIILTGLKAILKYKGAECYWEVLAYGKKDIGVLIVTQIDREFIKTDKEILSHFWDSLKLKF